jgi:proteic killer suppression protein
VYTWGVHGVTVGDGRLHGSRVEWTGPLITSFSDPTTKDLFERKNSARARKFPQDVRDRALDKLDVLDAAISLDDLGKIPGNRLEALRGDLAGYHSIRINDQWRVVFKWQGTDATEVHIADYQ